jgi:hypothetical protein
MTKANPQTAFAFTFFFIKDLKETSHDLNSSLLRKQPAYPVGKRPSALYKIRYKCKTLQKKIVLPHERFRY